MKERIYEMLEEIRPEFDFKESDDFVEDGYLDSFDIVTLVSMMEEEYDVVINNLNMLPENFSNVDTICTLISNNGGK